MQALTRILAVALGLTAVVLVALWLRDRPVVRFSLGPGEALVARPGVDTFAVQTAPGVWQLHDTSSRSAADGFTLPVPLPDGPLLAADGAAWGLSDAGLFEARRTGPRAGEVELRLTAAELPTGARLEALLAGRQPLLSVPLDDTASSSARALLYASVADPDSAGRLVLEPVAQGGRSARLAAEGPVIGALTRTAFALRGEGGWEAWSRDHDGAEPATWTVVVAEGCSGPAALFVPDGSALIVDGRQAGLWYLHLPVVGGDDPYVRGGSMELMARGNLGVSRRVETGHGFQRAPDRLVRPEWNDSGHLQIFQTHLGGGGKFGGLHVSLMHHYAVTATPDGRRVAWCQADFEESGDEPFREDLYVFDFDRVNEAAVFLGSRTGGRRGEGPYFVGSNGALVFVADGSVVRIECGPPGGTVTDSP